MNIGNLISTDYLSFEKDDVLSSVLGKLKENPHAHGLIFDKKQFLGVLSLRKNLKSKFDPSSLKVDKLLKKVSVLNKSTDVLEAIELMNDNDTHVLPVCENNKIVGIVSALSLIPFNPYLKNKTVSDIMSKNVISFNEDAKIDQVLKTFRDYRIDRVPIVTKEYNLVGIVTLKDIYFKYYVRLGGKVNSIEKQTKESKTRALHSPKDSQESFSVSNEMVREVYTVSPDQKVESAVQILSKNNISSVVVLKDKKVVGILALKDLLWMNKN